MKDKDVQQFMWFVFMLFVSAFIAGVLVVLLGRC